MQGIQHLFRQQAVDKQSSIESWHSANQPFHQPYSNGRSVSNDSNGDVKPPAWNQGNVMQCRALQFLFINNMLVIRSRPRPTTRHDIVVESPSGADVCEVAVPRIQQLRQQQLVFQSLEAQFAGSQQDDDDGPKPDCRRRQR